MIEDNENEVGTRATGRRRRGERTKNEGPPVHENDKECEFANKEDLSNSTKFKLLKKTSSCPDPDLSLGGWHVNFDTEKTIKGKSSSRSRKRKKKKSSYREPLCLLILKK